MFDAPPSFRRLPPVVRWILLINVGVFLAQWLFDRFGGPSLVALFGLTPALVWGRLWLWQPITYLFLHGGFFHIFFNMFLLWTLGRELEQRWGSRYFLTYYLVCGLGGAGFDLLFEPHSFLPTIGASAAIYGLIVAFAVLYPQATFLFYFFIPLRAWQMALILGVISFMAGFAGSASNVAHLAHLGGLLTGFVFLKARVWSLRLREIPGRWEDRRRERHAQRNEFTRAAMGQEVDRILEKVLREGLGSLDAREKSILERYSKTKR